MMMWTRTTQSMIQNCSNIQLDDVPKDMPWGGDPWAGLIIHGLKNAHVSLYSPHAHIIGWAAIQDYMPPVTTQKLWSLDPSHLGQKMDTMEIHWGSTYVQWDLFKMDVFHSNGAFSNFTSIEVGFMQD